MEYLLPSIARSGERIKDINQQQAARNAPSMKTPLVLRYFIWSMLIFAMSVGAFSFRMLRPLELHFLDLALIQSVRPDIKSVKEVDPPFATLPMYDMMSQETYLEAARYAVRRLKIAGAKVVIVPLPEQFRPSPGIIKSIQEIVADSVAVFGVPSPLNSPSYRWRGQEPLDEPRFWWVNHPMYGRLKMPWGVLSLQVKEFSTYGRISFNIFLTMFSLYMGDYSPLYRFVPVGFREGNTGEPVADVAVLALKRYFDIPDGEEFRPSGSGIRVGPYSIQIERDGLSYIRPTPQTKQWELVYATVDPVTDSLSFSPTWDWQLKKERSLEEAWQSYKGKIVFIDLVSPPYRFPTYGWSYLQAFSTVFNRSFVRVRNEWSMLLITTLVVFLSIFSYTFRSGYMIVLSLILAIATLFINVWLFNQHNILFEPIYILLPIILCGTILPIVKVAGEKRLAEERIKSLEEENQRLLDLQRSTPPPNSL